MRAITATRMGLPWYEVVREQLARSRPILIFVATLSALVMAAAQAMSMWLGQPIWYFTQDPATTAEMSWSLGLVSQFGVMLWSAAVAVCALAGAVLWPSEEQRPWALFAFASAAVTLVYLLDDALLLHENVLRDHLGIPEVVTYAAYAILGLAYLVRFAWAVRRTDFLLLVGSLACGGLSMAVDLIDPYLFWLEDGAKFLAVALWFAYYFQATSEMLRPRLPRPASRDQSPRAR